MLHWERGIVVAGRDSWPGVARLRVRLEDHPGTAEATTAAAAAAADGAVIDALAYPELTGTPEPGETVLLNTNALRRGLGTGGEALVIARPDALPAPETPAGHMMKARYTPQQTMVDALEDPASPHHAVMAAAESLEGMPVVATDLHSSLPAVVAGVRATVPGARIVLVHADAAALPAAYSRTAAVLREHGLLEGVISAGQAFGGDHEAVTLHSALLGARHVLGAEVAVVVQGPGNLGSGTPWGFSGLQVAEALHATASLGGAPVGALRVSEGDARERHRGLSHHAGTALGRACWVPAELPVLAPVDPEYSPIHASVREQVDSMILASAAARGVHHRVVEVGAEGLGDALEALPLRLSTMGRSLAQDRAAFLLAALAGRRAARLIPRP